MSSSARFDELKKKFDENPRRYFAPLANEFRKSGDAEQAVMICEEFLPQQPGHMSGHIVYGQALFDLGRLDDARTVFETALTLDPENLIALRHLGDIARAHGDLESARTWYQRVLEADPRNEEVQALVASLDTSGSGAAPHGSSSADAPVLAESPLEPASTPAPGEPATTVELESVYELTIDSPPPLPAAPPPAADSLLDLDVVDEHALGPANSSRQAEGFEAMEFTAPPSSGADVGGMAADLESGEFSAPQASVAPLEGLEETAIGAFEARPSPAAPASTSSLPDLEPMSDMEPTSAMDQPPVDIPPEVIAAEAELIDAREAASASGASTGESNSGAAASPSAVTAESVPPRVTPSQPFVTETMAELYMKQGFREQALDVYKLLLAASPESQRLRDRVAELQPRAEVDAGPNVREFFARIAARRPGDGGAATVPPAADDFASLDSFDTLPESTSAATARTPSEPPATAPELSGLPMLDDESVGDAQPSSPSEPSAAASTQGAGEGSIDALFGQRPVGSADASAASALAQAFGNAADDAPPISGRPARAAAGELSLDSVFRDGGARPPRNAQSFSFDQFFSESAASEPPAEPGPAPTPSQGSSAQSEPAERNPDDIEQFNSWLQGLKQR